MTGFRLTLVLLFFVNTSAASGTNAADPNQEFFLLVYSMVVEEYYDEVMSELVSSGLSEEDAGLTLIAFARESSMCVVRATRAAIQRRGKYPNKVLLAIDTDEMHEIFESELEFDELAEPCILAAFADAGIKHD